ncbi:MAG: Hsp20 family protein [Candidatus Eisenbacteria bacterium]|nr:Hsp20 family protein [Candidatus Eisenbacteria bacterium]
MELVRWRPRRNLPAVQDELDRAFDRLLRNWMSPASLSEFDWNPSVDISETEDAIVVTAEVPGVSMDDVDVSVDENQLVISGEKRQEEEEKEKNYYRMERSYGSFKRIFTLPRSADIDRVAATHKDGVLTVTVPKTEVARGKKVEVKNG